MSGTAVGGIGVEKSIVHACHTAVSGSVLAERGLELKSNGGNGDHNDRSWRWRVAAEEAAKRR